MSIGFCLISTVDCLFCCLGLNSCWVFFCLVLFDDISAWIGESAFVLMWECDFFDGFLV